MEYNMKNLNIVIGLLMTLLPLTSFANDNGSPPQEVESQISETETSFIGARILHEGVEITGGSPDMGIYEDDSQIYGFWQGDSLFFGSENMDSGNTIDGIAEFFWFESSIPKSSDFYVAVVKLKSSPNVIDDWQLAQEDNWLGEFMYDIKPSQHFEAVMEDSGDAGAIRWDWSVPFQNYKWEPLKTIQIEQVYSAGYDLSAGASANADPIAVAGALVGADFKEGGFLKDVNSDVNIQSKGYINSSYKVSSQYTVTLYRWEMVVLGGADNMIWNLVISKDGSAANDSAYHEYFMVIQSPQGQEVHLEDLHIGATFRNNNPLWFDGWDSISMTLRDITWIPPVDIECYAGDPAPDNVCSTTGVCSEGASVCAKGVWVCISPDTKEDDETICDGLDNDCDGEIDENLYLICSSECGKGTSVCAVGEYGQCNAPLPTKEVCDGLDNDCDGLIDNSEDCYPFVPDYWDNDGEEWNDNEETNSYDIEKLPEEPKDDAPEMEDNRFPSNIGTRSPEQNDDIIIEFNGDDGGCASSGRNTSILTILMFMFFVNMFYRRMRVS